MMNLENMSSKTVTIGVRGRKACFPNPSCSKMNRHSYDCITPSACRGILHSVFAKPEMDWVIKRIAIVKGGTSSIIRINEVNFPVFDSVSKMKTIYSSELRIQVNMTVLENVDYIIEAWPFILNPGPIDRPNSPAKYITQFNKHAFRGSHYDYIDFGRRKFPAFTYYVEKFPESGDPNFSDRLIPAMLLGISKARFRNDGDSHDYPYFFNAHIKNGIMEVPPFVAAKPELFSASEAAVSSL